jgi:hypothetical protein
MKATISTSPVSASWAIAPSRPAESNFGRKSLPCSRCLALSFSFEMGLFLSLYSCSRSFRVILLQDNNSTAPKSNKCRQGGFAENLSVK